MACGKHRIYVLSRNPSAPDSEAFIATGEILECLFDFEDRVREIEFGPFKPTDHCLILKFASGKKKCVYFNTSLELVYFFDCLLSIKINVPGYTKPRPVYSRIESTQEVSGWSSIYVVDCCHESGDKNSLDLLSKHCIEKYFHYSKTEVSSPEEVTKRWKNGVLWFNTVCQKLDYTESEENLKYFRHQFQEMLFFYVNAKWAEYFDQMSYGVVCSLYNIYSVALNPRFLADLPDWQARSSSLLAALRFSIEAAFINDTCFQIKRLVAELPDLEVSSLIKDGRLYLPAVNEISKLLESLAIKVIPSNLKFWKELIECICIE